jgi:hypothetical protein
MWAVDIHVENCMENFGDRTYADFDPSYAG